jgi:hypothetical protein
MLLPVLEVSLATEDYPDATAAETDKQLAAVTSPMLLQPLLKPRIVLADAFQLKGTRHVLLLYTFDHCPHSRVENPM